MPANGTTARLVVDLLMIALSLVGSLVLARRLTPPHERVLHTRFLRNRRAVAGGAVAGLLAGGLSVSSGALLGGLLTAVLVGLFVAAAIDRVAPRPVEPSP